MGQITIKDVAERAGVAVGTVSRVLNGSGPVHSTTAARVREAIEALQYVPNAAGRALKRGASRSIGIVVPTLSNPIFAASVDGIEDIAREAGFAAILTHSRYEDAREEAAIADLVARGVEGLVLTLSDASPQRLQAVAAHGLPFVLLYNPPSEGSTVAMATVDSRRAMDEATGKLLALGHRRIAFVSGTFAASDRAKARFEGYRDAMDRAGLPLWPPVEVDFLADATAFDDAITTLLTRLNAPTALIASNDFLALQVLAAARRVGLTVPDDLSVLGFDGLAIAQITAPRLATVHQPAKAMGAEAATILLDMLSGAAPRVAVLPHAFMAGETLGAPPARSPTVGPERAARLLSRNNG